MSKRTKWNNPPYTRRDGDNACWVKDTSKRPKAICVCFGPKGAENAASITREHNSFKDLFDLAQNIVNGVDVDMGSVVRLVAEIEAAGVVA